MLATTTPTPCAWKRFALLLSLLWVAGCWEAASLGDPGGWRPWVEGGQTGALMPPCGLTPSAAAGDSIPGGRSGIVLHPGSCVGFVATELELRDEDGMMVSFEVEQLPGGALLLRPRGPLMAGVYRLSGPGLQMQPVVAVAPAEVPTRLGQLEAEEASCGASVELTLDPLVLEYLPQLKLSVSVDGGGPQVWFDYGTLNVADGRAELSLPECFPSCLANGSHLVRVTAELAGEQGTLEPIEVMVQTACPVRDEGDAPGCGAVSPGRPSSDSRSTWLWALLVALAMALGMRRARNSASPGLEPPQIG